MFFMKNMIFQLLLVLAFFVNQTLNAQNHQKFNNGVIACLKFSELEGQEITDYYRINRHY